MGSCLSITCSRNKRSKTNRGTTQSAPPSPEEEPIVKEVLSETPKPSFAYYPKQVPSPSPPAPPPVPLVDGNGEGVGKLQRSNSCNATRSVTKKKKEMEPVEESEEVSEMCSVSETISVSTTFTDKGGETEEEESKRRLDSRSPAKFQRRHQHQHRSLSGEIPLRRDQRRGAGARSSPSPVRRMDGPAGGRSFSGRECGQPARARGLQNVNRAPATERSYGRRSVSPAAKKRAVDQQHQHRISPGGKRAVLGQPGGEGKALVKKEAAAEGEAVRKEMREEDGQGEEAERKEGEGMAEGESLENPLVSLECFIFL